MLNPHLKKAAIRSYRIFCQYVHTAKRRRVYFPLAVLIIVFFGGAMMMFIWNASTKFQSDALYKSLNRTDAAATATLAFSPASLSVGLDQQFSLNAQIDPGTNAVSGVEMHITYDPTKFRLDSITPSPVFSVELQAVAIDNVSGKASVALGVPLPNPSVTTVTTVASLSFHAVAAVSAAPITFLATSIASADGESSDMLVSRLPASVMVVGGADTISPTVSITAPVNNAIIARTVTISASASDNVGVAGVQFRLDGVNLGTEILTAPYQMSWNTAVVSNGLHTLSALVRDAAGNQTVSANTSVTVKNRGSANSGKKH